MVSNLLVVLCSEKGVEPVVNAGRCTNERKVSLKQIAVATIVERPKVARHRSRG